MNVPSGRRRGAEHLRGLAVDLTPLRSSRDFGPRVSVVSGGVLCVLGAGLVAAAFPALRRYRSDIVAAAPSPTAL